MEMQITITIRAQGKMQIQSNSDNPLAIYGGLEMAKQVVLNQLAQQPGTGIVAAPANALNHLSAAGK